MVDVRITLSGLRVVPHRLGDGAGAVQQAHRPDAQKCSVMQNSLGARVMRTTLGGSPSSVTSA